MDNRTADGSPEWAQRLADFEGGAEALAEELAKLTGELGLDGADAPEPTARLVRYYAAEAVIDKPERRGKEAIFGFKQLAQFLAARVLARDGWPLKKIAEDLRDRDIDELLALIPTQAGAEPAPSAAELVRNFQAASAAPERPPEFLMKKVRDRQYDAASRKARLSQNLATFSSQSATPDARDAVRIDLTDQITLLLDQEAFAAMTEEQAQALGDAVRDALLEARRSRSLPKKP